VERVEWRGLSGEGAWRGLSGIRTSAAAIHRPDSEELIGE